MLKVELTREEVVFLADLLRELENNSTFAAWSAQVYGFYGRERLRKAKEKLEAVQ